MMCSAHCCTDQRSGAGLNVHWAADRPLMLFRKLVLVCSSCCTRNARSSSFMRPLSAAQRRLAPSRIRVSGFVMGDFLAVHFVTKNLVDPCGGFRAFLR